MADKREENQESNNNTKYVDSNIDSRIIKAVTEMGFTDMTPIQTQAIPAMMEGRDIIGQAQTGTGKTAAFGIPVLQMVNPKNRFVQAIILCPTRELAIQAANEMRKFAKYMQGVKIVPVYGGQDIVGQIKLIKSGAQIVVGTPGRVIDHINRRTLKMENIKIVVLDEADEMLNMGFREDMETILNQIEGEHQTTLFSATMPKPILDITHRYQKKDAVHIRVAAKELTIPLVTQYYYTVKGKYKSEAVNRLLQANSITRSIVFCNTKKMVDDLVGDLKQYGYVAEGLHGDLSQKQRDLVMKHFRGGHTGILVATDVAARGIDVDDLEAVINYDIPQDIEYYVHRIGRTGRAGKEGVAFTLVTRQDFYRIKDIEHICRTKMVKGHLPESREITAIQSEKHLSKAKAYMDEGNLLHIRDIIENYIDKSEEPVDMIDLAAALLKMHIGEETTDIHIEDKIYDYRSQDRNRPQYRGERYGGYGNYGNRGNGGESNQRRGSFGKAYGSRYNDSNKYSVKDRDGRVMEESKRRRDGYSHGGYSDVAYKSTRKFGKK